LTDRSTIFFSFYCRPHFFRRYRVGESRLKQPAPSLSASANLPFALGRALCPNTVMKRYGVKLNNGKIMWVQAETVECRDGALLFLRTNGDQKEIVAGFSLAQVNHWGVPDAFAPE
jgi:hypothetical protein